MSTKIRLTRMGKKKSPFYRVIVTDSRKTRDGQYIDQIGAYAPMEKDATKALKIDVEKAEKWISKGAEPTLTVKELFSESEVFKNKAPLKKKKNKRKNRLNPIKDRIKKEKKEEKKESIAVKPEAEPIVTTAANEADDTKKNVESVGNSSEIVEAEKKIESPPLTTGDVDKTEKNLESKEINQVNQPIEAKKNSESLESASETEKTDKNPESKNEV